VDDRAGMGEGGHRSRVDCAANAWGWAVPAITGDAGVPMLTVKLCVQVHADVATI